MKHIKIFEDYSDEEIKGLQDTLHGIGHKSKWTFGEDFGFGYSTGFRTEMNGKEYPVISSDFFNFLLRNGVIVPKGQDQQGEQIYKFKDPEDFGIPDDFNQSIGKGLFREDYVIRIKHKNYMKYVEDSESAKIFSDLIQKLGEIRK